MMNLNVRTHFQLISLAVPFLKKRPGSNVVVLSSSAGDTPQPGATIYSTAMAMLNMLVKCSALETAYHGVRINAVAAGVTDTLARKKPESNGKDFDNNKFMNEQANFVPLF
jgi:NAD(P)-dependent dehydrogenase (short-subunit alcohol dehydrogenase family)